MDSLADWQFKSSFVLYFLVDYTIESSAEGCRENPCEKEVFRHSAPAAARREG